MTSLKEFQDIIEKKTNEMYAIRIACSIHGKKIDGYMIIKLKLFELFLRFLTLFVHS